MPTLCAPKHDSKSQCSTCLGTVRKWNAFCEVHVGKISANGFISTLDALGAFLLPPINSLSVFTYALHGALQL